VISIPRDNRRLVEAATHTGAIRLLAGALAGPFMAHWQTILGNDGARAKAADNVCLKWSHPIEPLPRLDERIVTRLGLDDRTVEFSPGTTGPFGSAISLVSIPGRWLGGVKVDDTPDIAVAAGELRITLGKRRFVYDRLGLRPAQDVERRNR
jgi:CRISPR-associated endonuclease/helicase Cas3